MDRFPKLLWRNSKSIHSSRLLWNLRRFWWVLVPTSPFHDPVKVPADLFRIEVRPRMIDPFNPVGCHQANVCVTHYKLSEHLYAVIFAEAPNQLRP